jgi:hypothetical protein
MKDWSFMQVRKAILEKIEKIVSEGRDPTISNPTQFVDLALREKIEKLESFQK